MHSNVYSHMHIPCKLHTHPHLITFSWTCYKNHSQFNCSPKYKQSVASVYKHWVTKCFITQLQYLHHWEYQPVGQKRNEPPAQMLLSSLGMSWTQQRQYRMDQQDCVGVRVWIVRCVGVRVWSVWYVSGTIWTNGSFINKLYSTWRVLQFPQ